MKKALFPILIILTFPIFLQAQFLTSYSDPGGNDCSFNSVVDYGNGNVLVVGTVGNKLLIAEADSNGNVATSHTVTLVDENATPVCTKAILDVNGKVVIVGYRGILGDVSTYNAFIMRYSFNSNSVLWVREWQTIPGDYGALFTNVVSLANGNYQLCGSFSDPANAQEGIIATVNRNNGTLTIQSLLNYGESADDFTSFLRFNNKIYTLGRNNLAGSGFGQMRPCVSILSNSGAELNSLAYVRDYLSTARLYGVDIKAMGNKIYAAVFGDNAGIELYKDLYLLRLNANGSAAFTKKIDFPEDHDGRIQTINPTADNKLIVYGNKYDGAGAYTLGNAFLISFTTGGNSVYAKSYSLTVPIGGGAAGSMIITTSVNGQNNVWAVGRRYNEITGHYDGAILKVDAATGELENCETDETISIISESNTAYGIDMQDETTTNTLTQYTTSQTNITLTGSSRCAKGLNKEAMDDAMKDVTISAYPNPASSVITISYSLPSETHMVLDIFDLTGRKLNCLLNKDETAGAHDHVLDQGQLPPGVYILRIQTNDGEIATSKLIVE